MFLRKFEKKDRQIFTIATLCFLLSLGLTLNDSWVYKITNKDLDNLQSIGSVSLSKNDVRRRYKVAFSWAPIKNEQIVYQGDSIFTGDDSEAIIKTQSGEEIVIAANSLVVINTKKDSISIDIGFGSIEGRVGKGKKLLISSNNNLTELNGENAKVKIDAGGGEKIILNVLEGEVKVNSDEGTTTLAKNQAAELLQKGIYQSRTKLIKLELPLDKQRIRYNVNKPIKFIWSASKSYPRTRIKVSDSANFDNVLINEPVDGDNFIGFGLPADQELFWMVLAEGAESITGSFWLIDDRSPSLILPQQGEQFYVLGSSGFTDVKFKWDGGSPARKYKFQISQDQIFSEIAHESVTNRKSTEVKGLSAGTYYWRVKSLEFPDIEWSAPAQFRIDIRPTKELVPPRPDMDHIQFLLTDLHKVSASKFSDMEPTDYQKYIKDFPSLSWSKVKNAEVYDLQIAESPLFQAPILNTTIYNSRYVWKSATPGSYYWRIRSRGKGFITGKYSPPKKIDVEVVPPLATNQSTHSDEVTDPLLVNAPPPPLSLDWIPTVFTKSYEVVLSSSPTFKNPIRFRTESSSKTVQLPKPGTYYWKIRSLDRNSQPVSTYSRVNTLEFKRAYKDPAISNSLVTLSPKHDQTIIMVGSGQSEILFEWNRPFNKATYELEVSYDIGFNDIAYKVTTPYNKVPLQKTFASTIAYWRVRAIDQRGKTPWTNPQRFLVQHENTPFDIDTSEKLHYARVKARERQQRIRLAIQKKIQKLRLPSGFTDVQLDKPILDTDSEHIVLESNLPPHIKPEDLIRLTRYEYPNYVKDKPLLRWSKVRAAERYFIEISRDPEFQDAVIRAPSYNPYYLWEKVHPGKYYWRVQAFNERYTRSEYSNTGHITVVTEPITPTSPNNFVEFFDTPEEFWPPPSPFTLSWTPRLFAKSYEIQFSESFDFSSSKTIIASSFEKELRVSKPGLYYWRTRALNENNIGISRWSGASVIEVTQTQRTPASLGKLTGLFPLDRTMLFIGKGLMNLAFYIANPFSTDTTVEVARDPKFKSIVAKATSQKNKVLFREDLPEGDLYWRISGGTQVSKIYKFNLKKISESYKSQRQ